MAYSSFSFPASTPIFPPASVVLEYLNDYADHFHLTPYIHLNTAVKAVHRDPANSQWLVTLSTDAEPLPFDLVVVCNGHYNVPLYPDIPGLAQWLKSGKATHSAYYRRPHDIGNTVLVIGGGPSGQDISSEMRSCADTVIHSVPDAPHEDLGNLKRRGRVVQFHEDESGKGRVTFEDGTSEFGIDHCILATGYEFSLPFLHDDIIRSSFPPHDLPLLSPSLRMTKSSIFPLAKHIFPLQVPSTGTTSCPPWGIAFVGRILARVAPFPVFETQARAILHAFAHPESLDPTKEMMDVMARHEVLRLRLESDDPLTIVKAWHRFQPLEQFPYRDALHEFAWSCRGKGTGKVAGWEKEMYISSPVLRKVWVELERRGEAGDWVRGVGRGDRESEERKREWLVVLNKMLKWVEEGGLATEVAKSS
jgi:hypothetical protein